MMGRRMQGQQQWAGGLSALFVVSTLVGCAGQPTTPQPGSDANAFGFAHAVTDTDGSAGNGSDPRAQPRQPAAHGFALGRRLLPPQRGGKPPRRPIL